VDLSRRRTLSEYGVWRMRPGEPPRVTTSSSAATGPTWPWWRGRHHPAPL